jgi:hypothetical protein
MSAHIISSLEQIVQHCQKFICDSIVFVDLTYCQKHDVLYLQNHVSTFHAFFL